MLKVEYLFFLVLLISSAFVQKYKISYATIPVIIKKDNSCVIILNWFTVRLKPNSVDSFIKIERINKIYNISFILDVNMKLIKILKKTIQLK